MNVSYLQVRICHHNRSLTFGTELNHSHDDVNEGPFLQSMPSEVVRNQLITLAQVLSRAVETIRPHDLEAKREDLKALIVNSYMQTARKEHQRVLQRRQIIEERKEELENQNVLRVSLSFVFPHFPSLTYSLVLLSTFPFIHLSTHS